MNYSLNAGTYQSSGTFGSLAAGTYTVTVQDAVLSTFDVSVTITQPAISRWRFNNFSDKCSLFWQ